MIPVGSARRRGPTRSCRATGSLRRTRTRTRASCGETGTSTWPSTRRTRTSRRRTPVRTVPSGSTTPFTSSSTTVSVRFRSTSPRSRRSPTGERKEGTVAANGSHPFDYRWNSGAHLSRELDGTINKSDDEDEEWVIEMAIPLASLGLEGEKGERIGLSIRRCDTPHARAFDPTPGVRSCGSWGSGAARGVLVLD